MPFVRAKTYGFFRDRAVNALNTYVTDVLATAKAKLFTAAANPPNEFSVPADFTEAAFGGYAAVDLTDWIPPNNLPSGEGKMVHSQADFTADNTITPPGEMITGFFITDAAGAEVFFAEVFDTPIPIVAEGDNISLDVIMGVPFSAPTGA